ncbi:MAG: hypothetical protein R2751_16065 [Bacteroidales bacterium]
MISSFHKALDDAERNFFPPHLGIFTSWDDEVGIGFRKTIDVPDLDFSNFKTVEFAGMTAALLASSRIR